MFRRTILLTALLVCLVATASADDKAFPAHRVVGNVYYVGSHDLASYLITTPEGHLLINSGFEETVPLIQSAVESLGFKMTDVKILLASHAHSDHVAGHAKLRQITGSKVYVMRGDHSVIASGGQGQYLYADSRWPPCLVDRVLEDGDEVKLGGTTLVAHRTPGHTRGCTTWAWQATDGGKKYDVVVIGSPNVNPGYRLVGNQDYPQIADDFAQTFAMLKKLPCDVFLGAHGNYYGMHAKYERRKAAADNPFIDPRGYQAYVGERARVFESKLAEQQGKTSDGWLKITEDDNRIHIETDLLEAAIPKANPKHWMTGIEKHSFRDKTTGFREIGDGLMVVDWLMEAGSDAEWSDKVIAPDGHGVGRYSWFENESDPGRRHYNLMAHGSSHRKRMVEGPQLCHRMKPVRPEVIRGTDFVAVKTTYRFEYAAPGRKPGSQWTQLIVFPRGERYFLLMDQVDCLNGGDEVFLRNDTPGCVRHDKGDTFSEMYLSYLSGPKGVRIPSKEFFEPFPPDLKFGYRRDTHQLPKHFIRAYHLRNSETGADGPWLAGLTLDPSVVYESWCSQRPGGIIVMIQEIHGRPIKPGESFRAAHVVGFFDDIDAMHAVYDRYRGHTGLSVSPTSWRLEK